MGGSSFSVRSPTKTVLSVLQSRLSWELPVNRKNPFADVLSSDLSPHWTSLSNVSALPLVQRVEDEILREKGELLQKSFVYFTEKGSDPDPHRPSPSLPSPFDRHLTGQHPDLDEGGGTGWGRRGKGVDPTFQGIDRSTGVLTVVRVWVP